MLPEGGGLLTIPLEEVVALVFLALEKVGRWDAVEC
jgi:hypothetical protein